MSEKYLPPVVPGVAVAGDHVLRLLLSDGIDLAPEPLYEQVHAHPLAAA